MLAHLWLVPNPAHNPRAISASAPTAGALSDGARTKYTFSTIGLYRAALFAPPWCAIPPGNPQGVKAALAPLLRAAMDAGRVSAELYDGAWTDVGTPDRLAALNDPRPRHPLTTHKSAAPRSFSFHNPSAAAASFARAHHEHHHDLPERRAAVPRTEAGGGIALLPTAREYPRNRDSDFPYRHDSYFYYLTGFDEPTAGW